MGSFNIEAVWRGWDQENIQASRVRVPVAARLQGSQPLVFVVFGIVAIVAVVIDVLSLEDLCRT